MKYRHIAIAIIAVYVAVFLVALFPLGAHAAVTTTPGAWDLYRGTSKISAHASEAACVAAADALGVARTYTCRTRTGVVVTVDPAPPAPTPAATWTECARETQTCVFAGRREVRYGGKLAGQQMLTRVGEAPLQCDDATFGAPTSTYENFCWFADSTTTAPITTGGSSTQPPAPAPDPSPAPAGTAAGPRVATFTASGPISATSGQTISGLRISNPGGNCIDIVGVSNVTVRDSEIGPCGGAAVNVTSGANNITVEHNAIHDVAHGVQATRASNVNTLFNTIRDIPGAAGQFRHAIEYSWMDGGTVEGNEMTGSFPNDVMSGFESSNLRFIGNTFDVSIAESTGASFTIGDSTTGNPGSNNYIARNVVIHQQGGVPAGVFGSTANTVLENNCFTAGIQAYNFSGVFNGVTVRNNVIGPGSFVPDTSVIAGWSTNVFSTDCSLVPRQ